MLILGFPEYEPQALALADALQAPCDIIDVHCFPDGESRVRLPTELPEQVIFCRSLDQANSKLVELMLAADNARGLGASKLTLVAPYLCYMRQDMAFHPGEAVSQQIIGNFLGRLFESLITVDPHLHRVTTLQQAIAVEQAVALSAAPLMGQFLANQDRHPVLVGPDQESAQWVRQVAATAGLDFVVASKTRHGDRQVEILLPDYNYRGKEAVLIDDVASSGKTLIETAHSLKQAGVKAIDVLVTHGLFMADAIEEIHAAGVRNIWSSDSIPHSSNTISLALLLAAAVNSLANAD